MVKWLKDILGKKPAAPLGDVDKGKILELLTHYSDKKGSFSCVMLLGEVISDHPGLKQTYGIVSSQTIDRIIRDSIDHYVEAGISVPVDEKNVDAIYTQIKSSHLNAAIEKHLKDRAEHFARGQSFP